MEEDICPTRLSLTAVHYNNADHHPSLTLHALFPTFSQISPSLYQDDCNNCKSLTILNTKHRLMFSPLTCRRLLLLPHSSTAIGKILCGSYTDSNNNVVTNLADQYAFRTPTSEPFFKISILKPFRLFESSFIVKHWQEVKRFINSNKEESVRNSVARLSCCTCTTGRGTISQLSALI